MRPDPFSALDQIQPPDQWDDIVQRATADTEVELLGDPPRRPVARQARAWVAAAAVLALVAGGIVLATRDDTQGVEVDPAATTTDAQMAESCRYTVELSPDVVDLEPGRHVFEPEMGILAGSTAPAFTHGVVDGLGVEVAVGTAMTTAASPEPGSFRTGAEGAGGFVEVAGMKATGVPAPCDQAVVVVRKPLTRQEWTDLEAGGPVPRVLSRTLDAVLAAISVRPSSEGQTAGAVGFAGPCPFTVDPRDLGFTLDPGRSPIEPELGIRPGPVEPSFAHGQVEDVLVEVAVGTGLTTTTAAGDVSGITDGAAGWFDTFLTTGTGEVTPCDRLVVAVRIPVAADTVASGLDPDAVNAIYAQALPILDAVDAAVKPTGGAELDDGTVPPRVEGTLADGSPFEVWEDPGHGLCASLGDVELGCDDVGPVLSPDADPSTPRLGIDRCCPPLWFGYLPEGAVDVVLHTDDGEQLDVDAVIRQGLWALPIPAEQASDDAFDSDTIVTYVFYDDSERPAPTGG